MRTGIVTGVIAAIIVGILIFTRNVENGPTPFVVLGIAQGAVFGLIALGLVLVYKGTRVFNFAAGEFGTLGAYGVFLLLGAGLPHALAIPISILGVLLLGLVIERVAIRPLLNAPRITVLVATIALALLLVGAEILLFRAEPRTPEPFINASGVSILGVIVSPQDLIAAAVLSALGVGLAYFFSRTDLGLAVLATSQDAFATRVVGIGVDRMSRFIWGSAAVLGAIAGIIYVPIGGLLTPAVVTSNVLIPSFTAAVVGGMTSLPGAFLGGVVIGVVQALALWSGNFFKFTSFDATAETEVIKSLQEIVPGVDQVAIFSVLLIILLARPSGLLGKEA